MAATPEGIILRFCNKKHISVELYKENTINGLKWCTGCKVWHSTNDFGKDKTRNDGLSAMCFASRKILYKRIYIAKARPSKGRRFVDVRDGDKKQARRRINYLVESGLLPHPNALPCVDCGHIWKEGERRHEYDHYNGYDVNSHCLVHSVCSKCHKKRTCSRTHSNNQI